MTAPLAVGIDIGTSGVRAVAIDREGNVAAEAASPMPSPRRSRAAIDQDPEIWWSAVATTLRTLGGRLDPARIAALSVDGTSGTVVMIDASGAPIGPGLMYNDARAAAEAGRIAAAAPPESGAHGATSALGKLLWALGQGSGTARAVHQADWIAGRLIGRHGMSDENNALKMGYDPVARRWPDWIAGLGVPPGLLPEVRVPGERIGALAPGIAAALGLPAGIPVAAGTTDGVAAFLATGAERPGDAVTSLGSTLVLKLVSERPVFAPASGVYSHRLGDLWLAGGASNSGGAALAAHLDAATMAALTPRLDPVTDTGLDYYPLPGRGERFPVNDPTMEPRLTPRPADDARFFQGLLEGVARIERAAYARLGELGAPPVAALWTVGGGAANPAWTRIRARILGAPMRRPISLEAAYGTARLALRVLA